MGFPVCDQTRNGWAFHPRRLPANACKHIQRNVQAWPHFESVFKLVNSYQSSGKQDRSSSVFYHGFGFVGKGQSDSVLHVCPCRHRVVLLSPLMRNDLRYAFWFETLVRVSMINDAAWASALACTLVYGCKAEMSEEANHTSQKYSQRASGVFLTHIQTPIK